MVGWWMPRAAASLICEPKNAMASLVVMPATGSQLATDYRRTDINVNKRTDFIYTDAMGVSDSLKKRISGLRKEKGLSQKELAVLAGVRQPSISDLETGKTTDISGATLVGIATALGVRAKWLLEGRGPKISSNQEALKPDELEMLEKYRKASPRWRLSLRLLADVKDEDQDEVSESVNVLMARIFAKPVSDEKVAKAYGKPPQFTVDEAPPTMDRGDRGSRTSVKFRKR
jgi:transcriptional regulator with XRE-family HTH domain